MGEAVTRKDSAEEVPDAQVESVAPGKAEDELARSLSVLRATLESTADGILVVDLKGRIVTVNQKFIDMWRIPESIILARDDNQALGFVLNQLKDANAFITKVRELYSNPESASFDMLEFIDGRIFERFSQPQRISGKVVGRVWSFRDVTERKRMENALKQSEQDYRGLFENAHDAIIIFSPDYEVILDVNDRACELYGYTKEEFVGLTMEKLSSDVTEAGRINEMLRKKLRRSFEAMHYRKDLSRMSIEINAALVNYKGRKAILSINHDITERKNVEIALRTSEQRYALVARAGNDGLWDWNLRTREVYFSPRWKSLLGYSEEEVSSDIEEWFKRIHPGDVDNLKAELNAHLESRTPHFENEHRMLHKNGVYRWMLCRGLAIRDNDSTRATRMAGSISDITERKVAEEQLLHDALHDALTGLPNRALFIDRLGVSIGHSKRRKDYLFAVLFLDLDRFKNINDSLGHMIGDELLISIGRRLETCLRPGDTVARLGGDEFAILLEDIKDVSDATRVAERIQGELMRSFTLRDQDVFTTASMGIALGAPQYERPEDLLRDADTAMYRAKALGKARHEMFDSAMHARAVALLQLETDLRKAVERKQFVIHYQPIFHLESSRVTGFEALVRWKHPGQGLIYPLEFIPLAEETGLISAIGQWVLFEACHQIKDWQTQFPMDPPLHLSVNLSSKQFTQPDLIDQVRLILQQTGIDPQTLKLEITESMIMQNAEAAINMLNQLRALDVQIHIDDFGTGYSSFSYLYR
ncbi:MAG TPA: EAL domain-containing protein, partial [Acidobacteriota bacterium]|nr:EAL domain-containing protein [Acidobacteriota bacterium]